MTIKDILLAGGSVTFGYKDEPDSWVGNATISGFDGGFGMPKINLSIPCIEIHGRKEFNYDQIDEAIDLFESLVFRPKNMLYKRSEVIRRLTENGDHIDLDIDEDREKVEILRMDEISKIGTIIVV